MERDYRPPNLDVVAIDEQNAYFTPLILYLPVHQPILDMLAAMNDAELQVTVISGYRDYIEQTLAFQKWAELYPDRVDNISAAPGHSEHQLATAVDFSSSDTGRARDRFDLTFARTPEGRWLNEHATSYGFVLSYPFWGVEQTAYEWEPWHFRYVGVELAQTLETHQITLTEYIRACEANYTP